MHFRKFLYKNPVNTDVVAWSIDKWTGLNPEVNMEITFADGRREYSVYVTKNGKGTVTDALAPVNELIASLSKAAMEFAKACNTSPMKIEVKDNEKPAKKAKKSESKAKANPAKG